MEDKTKKKTLRKRESPRKIKIKIITALIDSLNSNLSITLLAKKIGCHFPTTKKFILELEKETILNVIRIDDGVIAGVNLNYNSFMLICEALKDSEFLSVVEDKK